MTEIEYLGHAGIAVRYQNHLLVCDPWLGLSGAFNASWFPYPHYPHADWSELLAADAVYISHEHQDHFDPEFVTQLPRDTPILTGRTHKKRLVRQLRNLGFEKIIELDNFESYEIGKDFEVKISTPTYKCPPHWFDSCAMIHAGGRKIFNLNDCNLALPVDDLRAQNIDVLLAQASPAIWYPLTYTNYEREEQERLKRERRESAVTSFVASVRTLEPKLAVPFAGPPIFFDPELHPIFTGEDSMFPTPAVGAERLASESDIPAQVLKPGDRLQLGENGEHSVVEEPAYVQFDYERDRVAYFEQHAEDRQAAVARVLGAIPAAKPDLFNRFRRHLLPFIKGHSYFMERIDLRVLFEITGPEGGAWIADFRAKPDPRLVYETDGAHCGYRFTIESRYLEQVLNDEMSWEDLFLSLRFKAHRDPDVYNQYLFTLFKMHDSRALNAIMKAEVAAAETSGETFRLTVDNKEYEVQRYCPHGGSDLSEGIVEDGFLICQGHHWRFSLETGECETAAGKIHVRRVEPDPPLAPPTNR